MPDRLWTTKNSEDLADWRPERPEPPRARQQRKPLPERAPVQASEAPTEPVDVAAAAERVRGIRPDEPTQVQPPKKGKGAAPVAPVQEEGPVDVAAAAERIRSRQTPNTNGHANAGAAGAPSPSSGSPFGARSRPAPPVTAAPHKRGWVAPFLSAVVGALIVVIVFLLFFRDDVGNDKSTTPLSAIPGGGGSSANVRAVYARAADSVVSIKARMSSGTATGTGFLVDGRDTIVTNAHVVGTADNVQVQFGDRGQVIRGDVLGKDTSTDLAVVHIDPATHTANPLPLADSSDVRVGDAVVAIGNPFGLDRTATAGIVSATDRHISAPNGFDIDNVLQTDAPINPGNSGGPLLDARGRVIGINSQIATAGGSNGNVGIGFAVPVNTVRRVVPQLEQGKTIRRAFLGVTTTQGAQGAKIVEVTPSGPADTAGVRTGDEIVGINGKDVTSSDAVGTIIEGLQPGDSAEVVVVRNGAKQTIDVKLGTRPGG
jgi:putative serine protease PepD